ncbi:MULTISPECIES: ABC transporter ATP-binding protein [unclassified Devosia]|uniref:ABC transporter ATP-binding protein n=1 Tax=unclassified Devosia TaxID=196773 RepID=UPI0015F7F755|nr:MULTISPECIES: ABC transporter ATP-binding protein [unclassified Devosia]MBJ6987810.1 ABC transporter ATP-binding protein [Devosia sp. MC521]MBJ7579340.1 ABC transporter ATP-binding protein [Devosia sp. MC532]MBK1796190.1 ABC transporter ATP-binding protein [Devosia sp. WQ 349K1]QMW63718.1 ABC transporter ATP-binding protein [Devosia sp. MC521]
MTAVLETKNLEVFYGDFQAVFGVDFHINEGETVAIIGANGAGKSSFLKALSGLIPAKGQIMLDGQSVSGKPAYDMVKQGIALVPEGRRLFPTLSVSDNLRMGENGKSGERGWSYETICELFPLLAERADQLAPTLSGGQQQMVAIGRALITNPRVLLCDEISLGLSPAAVKDVYAAISEIKKRGTTIVIVEQDLNAALSAADRIYCFLEGKVSLAGRADEFDRSQILAAYFGN